MKFRKCSLSSNAAILQLSMTPMAWHMVCKLAGPSPSDTSQISAGEQKLIHHIFRPICTYLKDCRGESNTAVDWHKEAAPARNKSIPEIGPLSMQSKWHSVSEEEREEYGPVCQSDQAAPGPAA